MRKKSIGVLALQGAFSLHIKMINSLGSVAKEVRTPDDLSGLDALIIPGGESTTISKMMVRWELINPVKKLISDGFPVFGTCAGLILLSEHIEDWENLPRPGGLEITVRRNAYGRQIDSFETVLNIELPGFSAEKPFTGVFIRAPRIIPESLGEKVETLCTFEESPVLVRQQNILGASFHPEISGDSRVHEWFLRNMI